MFDALRLSVEVLAEVLPEVLAEVLPEVLADVAADVAGRTELVARAEIRQPGELKVLLVAVYC